MKEDVQIQGIKNVKKRQSNITEWLQSASQENPTTKSSNHIEEEQLTPLPQVNNTMDIRKGFVVMPFTTNSMGDKTILQRKIRDPYDLGKMLMDINRKVKEDHVLGLVQHLSRWEMLEEELPIFRNFIQNTIPKMQEQALRVSELFKEGIPLLEQNINNTITLTIDQVLCLMCNAFFGTFPSRDANKQKKEKHYPFYGYPSINFTSLYIKLKTKTYQKVQESKLKAIITYFDYMLNEYPQNPIPNGTLSFTRRVKRNMPDFFRSTKMLCPVDIRNTGALEDFREGAMADFANKYIGGGVIGHGCVQEEIQFLIHPECIISRLFAKKILDHEAIIIRGAHRFSNYKGYGNSFEWTGSNIQMHTYLRNEHGEADTEIIAIDAVNFSYFTYPDVQYKRKYLERELYKLYTGFSGLSHYQIATGNWGCGVFGGDVELKSLIQWMAMSQVNGVERPKKLVYFAYNKPVIKNHFPLLIRVLTRQQVTVQQVYRKLLTYLPIKKKHKLSVYQYIGNAFSNDEATYEILKPLFPNKH